MNAVRSRACDAPERTCVTRAILPGDQGPRPWTAEEEEELRALATSTASRKSIARHFGRTQGAIDARMGKLGLLPPRVRRTPD